jgi:hypothetical protein
VLIVGSGQHMVRKVIVQANRFLEVAGLNEEIAPTGTVAYRISSLVSLVMTSKKHGMKGKIRRKGHSPTFHK